MPATNFTSIFMTGILACSIGLNIYQTKKLRDLSGPRPDPLATGPRLASLTAKDLDGRKVVAQPADLPVILYFFSEACRWCERNTESLNALEVQTRGRYRLVGISLSAVSLRDYVTRHRLRFPVYYEPNPNQLPDYKVNGTPKTVVLALDGRVLKAWTGAYTGRQKDSIEDFFKIRLPEVPTT